MFEYVLHKATQQTAYDNRKTVNRENFFCIFVVQISSAIASIIVIYAAI